MDLAMQVTITITPIEAAALLRSLPSSFLRSLMNEDPTAPALTDRDGTQGTAPAAIERTGTPAPGNEGQDGAETDQGTTPTGPAKKRGPGRPRKAPVSGAATREARQLPEPTEGAAEAVPASPDPVPEKQEGAATEGGAANIPEESKPISENPTPKIEKSEGAAEKEGAAEISLTDLVECCQGLRARAPEIFTKEYGTTFTYECMKMAGITDLKKADQDQLRRLLEILKKQGEEVIAKGGAAHE